MEIISKKAYYPYNKSSIILKYIFDAFLSQRIFPYILDCNNLLEWLFLLIYYAHTNQSIGSLIHM